MANSPEAIAARPIARFGALKRPHVRGKFLFIDDEKYWVRGVTYGTFRPDENGDNFPAPAIVIRDFAAMAEAGFNAVRVYTVPPRWLLDAAVAHELRVMIGLPWEQHVTFLDDRAMAQRIVECVRQGVRACAGHPAVLCYAIGNEIPASVMRWYGPRRIERFLTKLFRVARKEDPGALITYVNFPTTEYLTLPFVDLVCFNVYLESQDRLAAYLARLQNIAGERPLLMGEIGLDSRRSGEAEQAESLCWQTATAFQTGCAGAFVFAWTDEWYRGGHEIEDWDFGLTTRERSPKPALGAMAIAMRELPVRRDLPWPRISVVVCSYNGKATIGETLAALESLDYPNFEIIVVDDGSTDTTAEIAKKYHSVHLIQTTNRGLSSARNTGMNAASGEIVAYIDDDAYPDAHWLTFLALSFMRSPHAGIGGPNLAPPGDGMVADCIANAPGGPVHVLLSDQVAEHIPGCNMAFRRDRLITVGGFDPQFRVAGDDVDVCWRLQERGWTLGFSPAAMVWHHRRSSIGRYLRQQWLYAKAEAALAEKWPSKYNGTGHLSWHGRLYGKGLLAPLLQRQVIYHGGWGRAPFQSLYERPAGAISSLPLIPEWHVLLAAVAVLSALGTVWPPLLWTVPLFVAMLLATLVQAARGGARASFHRSALSPLRLWGWKCVVAALHALQPVVRLLGRMHYGLGPWSRRKITGQSTPVPRTDALWSEVWQSPDSRLSALKQTLKANKVPVVCGSDFDRWDLAIGNRLFGYVRVLAMVEEHGEGKQLFRFRAWPKVPSAALGVILGLGLLSIAAAADRAWLAAAPLFAGSAVLALRTYSDCAFAMKMWRRALDEQSMAAVGSTRPKTPTPEAATPGGGLGVGAGSDV